MKKIFMENLATKLMALFLAIVTWVYLFMQDTGQADIEVEFSPILEIPASELAFARYLDAADRQVRPGDWIQARVSGPKADVRSLRPRGHRCSLRITAANLTNPEGKGFGTVALTLDRRHFDLPEKFEVDPLPSPGLTLHYARYDRRKFHVVATREDAEGELAPGYVLESITPVPDRIEALVPADRPAAEMARIRRVSVRDLRASFTRDPWELDDPAIKPLTPFRVEVKIGLVPESRRIRLPLHVTAKAEHLKRIKLQDKDILVELQGPKQLVDEAAERLGTFLVTVVVADRDMEPPPGPKNIRQIRCVILDPKYEAIRVVVMPDQPEENREVKVTVE